MLFITDIIIIYVIPIIMAGIIFLASTLYLSTNNKYILVTIIKWCEIINCQNSQVSKAYFKSVHITAGRGPINVKK